MRVVADVSRLLLVEQGASRDGPMTYGDGSPVLRTMWQCVDDGEPVEVYVARDYEGDDLVAGDSYRAGLSVLSEWVNGKYRPQRKNKIKLVVAKRVDADEQA